MSADTRAIREALAEPHYVAGLLGLLDRSKRQPRGGLSVLCPIGHDRKAPSLSLTWGDDATLRVRCFGCGLAGDVYTLIGAVDGFDAKRDFRRAFLRGAELAGIDPKHTSRESSPAPTPSPRRAPVLSTERFDAFARAMLARGLGPREAAYLDGRGVLDEARAAGWATVPELADVRHDLDHAELALTGVVLPSSSGFTHAAFTLAIPWRDASGRVQTIQRRRVDNVAGDRYVMASGRAPALPYGVERLAEQGPVAFVEGAVDAIALRVLAAAKASTVIPLGLPGVSAWRPAWAELVRGRRVLVATDADDAGDACAETIAADLAGVALTVERRKSSRRGAPKDWAELLERRRSAA